jgi:hypothetical protein
MEVKVPLLKEPVGLGDLAKQAIEKAGVKQTGGCGCQKRQAAMNRALTFTPAGEPQKE